VSKHPSVETDGNQESAEGHSGAKSKDHGEYPKVDEEYKKGLSVIKQAYFPGGGVGLTKTSISYTGNSVGKVGRGQNDRARILRMGTMFAGQN
jgi:hypothetical protein